MAVHLPGARWLVAGLFAAALVLYLATYSACRFPGLPTRTLLIHLRLEPAPSAIDALWGWLVQGLARLPEPAGGGGDRHDQRLLRRVQRGAGGAAHVPGRLLRPQGAAGPQPEPGSRGPAAFRAGDGPGPGRQHAVLGGFDALAARRLPMLLLLLTAGFSPATSGAGGSRSSPWPGRSTARASPVRHVHRLLARGGPARVPGEPPGAAPPGAGAARRAGRRRTGPVPVSPQRPSCSTGSAGRTASSPRPGRPGPGSCSTSST